MTAGAIFEGARDGKSMYVICFQTLAKETLCFQTLALLHFFKSFRMKHLLTTTCEEIPDQGNRAQFPACRLQK
jgi:hypothetical protein